MATCKECIHHKACFNMALRCGYKAEALDGAETCEDFQNKADFVEVARCKDCKHRLKSPITAKVFCTVHGIKQNNTWYGTTAINDNHFCSYGERK